MTTASPFRPHGYDWDVVVVGRSFAGLSAALMLGRARRSVLVVGTGGPRNESVHHAHGLLTRDHQDPAEIVAEAEGQLDRYPNIELVDARVSAINADPAGAGFLVTMDGRTTSARLVILATGVNDNPPPIPGLAEHWGRGVFTCPFCDGWEHQDLPLAVVGDPAVVPHVATLLRSGWSDRVTAYADGCSPEATAALAELGVAVVSTPIAKVLGDGESVHGLRLDDGSEVTIGAIFVAAFPTPNTQLAAALGADLVEVGLVVTDEQRATTVAGLWAIGDVRTRMHQMSVAIADGTLAGAGATAVLVGERVPPAFTLGAASE